MKTTLDPKPAGPSRRSQPVRWPRPTPTLRPLPSPITARTNPSPPQPPVSPAKVPRPSWRPEAGPCDLPPSSPRDTVPEIPCFDVVDETTLELEMVGGQIDDDDDDDDRPTLECFSGHGLATTWEVPESRSVDTLPPTGLVPCPGCGHRNGPRYDHCTVCGHRLGCHPRRLLELPRLSAPASWGPVLLVAFACASLLAVLATGTGPLTPTSRQPLWSAARGTPVVNNPATILRVPNGSPEATSTPPTPVIKNRGAHVKTSPARSKASTAHSKASTAHTPTSTPHRKITRPHRPPSQKLPRNDHRIPRR